MLMPAQGMGFNEIYGDGPSIDPNKWLGKAYTQTGVRLTLPTEAQWEYACRAGTAGERYGALGDIAIYAGNAPKNADGEKIPAVGGTKSPNAWGLYDMIGNMYEYVLDWMNPNAYKSSGDALNPTGPVEYIDNTGLGHAGKMWRGGCFEYNNMCTATYPYAWYKWGALAKYNGVRLVCPARQ
jgi:formylglycine-generating enzyme required for sulfatase activity